MKNSPKGRKTKLIQCMLGLALALAGLGFSTTPAAADSIAAENFESYLPGTGGSLVGNNDGDGWAGPWLPPAGNTANVVDTSFDPLSFTPEGGQTMSGGGRAVEVLGTANVITARRQLATPLTETFYAAYLVRLTSGAWDGNNTFSIHLADSDSNTGSSLNFGIRANPGAADPNNLNHFMVRTATGSPPATGAAGGLVELNATYYLVARLSKLDDQDNPSATYDRIELWVNPGDDALESAPNGHAALQLTSGTRASSITHALVRAAALHGDDIIQFDELILSADWPSAQSARPRIINVSPSFRQMFGDPADGIRFEVTSETPVPRENLQLILNEVDISADLEITGTPNQWIVSYAGLEAGLLYTGEIQVTSPEGEARASILFDTFREDFLTIEAEDFNFGGGQFFDDPVLCNDLGGAERCYFDRVSVQGTDALKTGPNANIPIINLYRYGSAFEREESVDTNFSADAVRPKFESAPPGAQGPIVDYDVVQMAAGDWLNYTRTFQEGNYTIHLRTRSAAPQQVSLSRVTDPASAGQTTTPLGVFKLPATGGYAYLPLTDAQGNVLTLSMAGVSTLRLTADEANNNLQLNFLIFAPSEAAPVPAFIASTSPSAGAVNVRPDAPVLVEIVNAGTSIQTSTIVLRVDGADVTASATINPTASGVSVSFEPGLLFPGEHSAVISFQDSAGAETSLEWQFEIINLPVLPEAWAAPPGTGAERGFKVRSAQTTNLEIAGTFPRNLTAAENQLALPPAVEVDFTGTDTPMVINYNETEAKGNQGYFNENNGFPDRGAREAGLVHPDTDEYFAVEITFFLDLSPGLLELGVNVNDGFSLRAGPGGTGLEAFPLLLGQRNGEGAATAATPQFPADFLVTKAGVYAFRLVWVEFVGSASVELHIKDGAGTTHLLNSETSPAHAFQTRTQEPPAEGARLQITRNTDGSVTISWNTSGQLLSAPAVTGPWNPVSNASNPYNVPENGNRFFQVAE